MIAECKESSSSEKNRSFDEETGLICLYSEIIGDNEECCLMANEYYVTFASSICSNNDTLYLNDDLMDSIIELMKGFKVVKATQTRL